MTWPTDRSLRDLHALLALFPPAEDLDQYAVVPAPAVPSPYRELLVHEHHMTVTVEAYHGDQVAVQVLQVRQEAQRYARKILLTLQQSGRVVQYGIMRIYLPACPPAVQEEIRAARTPLGRILIAHEVLRRIEPLAFLRIVPGPPLMRWFGLERPQATYGRLACIHCNGQPAVELLEIVAPAETAPGTATEVPSETSPCGTPARPTGEQGK
jgi:chorismate-pyruvate lyase